MSSVSYTEFRQNLPKYVDQAVLGRVPIVITRKGERGNVVLISEEEFAGWREAAHLLSNPRNAERIGRAVRQLEAGEGREHEPVSARPGG